MEVMSEEREAEIMLEWFEAVYVPTMTDSARPFEKMNRDIVTKVAGRGVGSLTPKQAPIYDRFKTWNLAKAKKWHESRGESPEKTTTTVTSFNPSVSRETAEGKPYATGQFAADDDVGF